MNDIQTGAIRPVECIKEAWELIKPDYWLLFAITLVGMLIGGATLYVLLGAMMCGIFYCYLQRIDGRPVVFDELWKGFQWWLPGLVAVIVFVVPVIVVYLVIYLPFVAALVMGSKLSESELLGLLAGAFAVDLVLIVVMVCIHTLLMFTFPLIVDRNAGAFEAMRLSARGVWRNLGGVAGLYGLLFVLNIVGAMTCVGIYLLIPVIMATTVVAYRKVFPSPSGFANAPAPPYNR